MPLHASSAPLAALAPHLRPSAQPMLLACARCADFASAARLVHFCCRSRIVQAQYVNSSLARVSFASSRNRRVASTAGKCAQLHARLLACTAASVGVARANTASRIARFTQCILRSSPLPSCRYLRHTQFRAAACRGTPVHNLPAVPQCPKPRASVVQLLTARSPAHAVAFTRSSSISCPPPASGARTQPQLRTALQHASLTFHQVCSHHAALVNRHTGALHAMQRGSPMSRRAQFRALHHTTPLAADASTQPRRTAGGPEHCIVGGWRQRVASAPSTAPTPPPGS